MAGFATIAALDEHSFVYGCLHPTASAAPAASGGSAPAASGGAVPEKLVNECKKAGEAVAAAKKSGASKDEIQAKVDKFLALKKQITALDPNHALAIVDKKKKAKATAAPEEKKGLSKREQKRLARGEDVKKKKKDKDPNRWAVDPAKAAAKAEKARLKALAKAEAEKADVRTPRLRVDGVEVPQRDALITQVKAIAPPTPKGDKKILAEQMSRTYNPADVEAAWQDWWEKSGWYGCDEKKALKRPADEKFVMVIPPPNVTGSLHSGPRPHGGHRRLPHAVAPHAGRRDALRARDGPCGYRYPERSSRRCSRSSRRPSRAVWKSRRPRSRVEEPAPPRHRFDLHTGLAA